MNSRYFAAASVAILCAASPYAVPLGPVASVPHPTVLGPIPATVPPGDALRDYPFFSTMVDLESNGYVEEEYFFEGTANRYLVSSPLQTATILDGGYGYRTRVIVRRPASPESFNGTVLMEWQNNALNYDLDGMWALLHAHIMRGGYASVGVTAFRAGVHAPVVGLRAWSPLRYGTLDVTAGGTVLDNALSFDIFSQAAQALKAPSGIDPMGGLAVARVIAVGASQSAHSALIPYHNSIHPLAGVIDGFLIVIGGGSSAIRTDLDVKVFKLWTETEAARSTIDGRQPDSDRLRRWEIAGTAHFGWDLMSAVAPLQLRDINPSPAPRTCYLPPFSRVSRVHVWNAAIDHMVAWVAHGIPPPHAPQIEIATIGDPTSIVRDSFGNALGGIRVPEHAVPTATNTGLNGPAICSTVGSYVPFDQATLGMLYPDHGTYVSRVARVAEANVAQGFMLLEDADATVRAAALSGIGKR